MQAQICTLILLTLIYESVLILKRYYRNKPGRMRFGSGVPELMYREFGANFVEFLFQRKQSRMLYLEQ